MPRLAVHQDHEVVYLVERKRVLIVAVLHGHRALRRALKDRL
jgi:plasmid stabilization system protein ParE